MTEKTLTLAEAEAQLAALEKPGHDVALANSKLRRAEMDGEAEPIAAAAAGYADALKRQEAAAVPAHIISAAAQLVLELRGHGHTEVNVLPPEIGLATSLAQRALTTAKGDGNKAAIAAAEEDLNAAMEADRDARAAHVAGGADRTRVAEAEAAAKGDV